MADTEVALSSAEFAQLTSWANQVVRREIRIKVFDGPAGRATYALDPDRPLDAELLLDSKGSQSPIYSAHALFGCAITSAAPDLSKSLAKLLYDFQAGKGSGLLPINPSVETVREVLASVDDNLLFYAWSSSDDPDERKIASNAYPEKTRQIRMLLNRLLMGREKFAADLLARRRQEYVTASVG